jgi:hypothetical protein
MPVAIVETASENMGDMLIALAAAEGSAGHPYTHSFELNADPVATRNLADVLHLLSILHGPQPGLPELAAIRNVAPQADQWFRQAVDGFAVERAYLAQLTAVAGPAPSTPGEAETSAAVLGQRHALMTIAASDRFGCALGAAAALLFDWQSIRAVLDTAATRIGIDVPQSLLPDDEDTSAMLNGLSPHPRLDRALIFGGRQVLVQHHGLWGLLEARAKARMG